MTVFGYEIKNFYTEIYQKAEREIIDLYYDQGLSFSTTKLTSNYYKKLFFNSLSKVYIENLQNSSEKIFYIIGIPPKNMVIPEHNYDSFIKSYMLNIKKFYKLYPINGLLLPDVYYTDFIQSEEVEEALSLCIPRIREINSKKNFSKLKSFINTYDLVYLNQKIFDDLKIKFILF